MFWDFNVKLLTDKRTLVKSLNKEIKEILVNMNSIIVNYSKDDITKFIKKLEKMKKKENNKDLELKKNVELELSIETNLDKLKRNNKEIKDTQKLMSVLMFLMPLIILLKSWWTPAS